MNKYLLFIVCFYFFLSACIPNNKQNKFIENCSNCANFFMYDTFNQSISGNIIYQSTWGNKVDSTKPTFDLSFISTYLKFPFYFPKSNVVKIGVDSVFELAEVVNDNNINTSYNYKYNTNRNIISFVISSPKLNYQALYFYDSLNRLNLIKEKGLTDYLIEYNSKGDVSKMVEINPNRLNTRTLIVKYN